ncbi:MAG: hypothetical protein PVG19_00100 [Desulfobacterales bacterium]|jgi:radical SAM superfamily enzyme YgiQ (UPF0313 family)
MRIGVLEILSDTVRPNLFERSYDHWFRRRFASIMPQAISAWCRQLGHQVFYATYYGQQKDPRRLMPDLLDIVFIAACTHVSPIAHMLAKRFRRQNILTVIGGPHASSFPDDCRRFFDIVVKKCDKAVLKGILSGDYVTGTVIEDAQPLKALPAVEERLPEVKIAHLDRGRATSQSMISLITSLGCPYHCDFCVDWDSPYVTLPTSQFEKDLNFISRHFPNAMVAYHDPNFGVEFDRIMGVICRQPRARRNPYIMECSLSILRRQRMAMLAETNCVYAIVGIETWSEYSQKAGLHTCRGQTKFDSISRHIKILRRYVPNLQINFLFGTDADSGDEPVALTKSFLKEIPGIWPVINSPIPLGGTPLYKTYASENRILKSMPFSFYSLPYLCTVLKNYAILDYYDRMVEIYKAATSSKVIEQRVRSATSCLGRFFHLLRAANLKKTYWELCRIRDMLKADRQLRDFHEGKTIELPQFYRHAYRRKLGPFSNFMTDADMIPRL